MKSPNPRKSPYVGPRPFEENEEIFGRSQDILNLSYLILSERIVLLYSPSGAGKSSLIQAGLKPELKKKLRFLPVIRVYEDPPDDLATQENFNRYAYSALVSLEEELPEEHRLPREKLAALTLSEYFSQRRHPDGKKAEISDQSENNAEPDYEILVFDQFEEILTIAPNDVEGKQDFFEQVGEALGDARRWALFVAREDYVAAFDPYKDAIPTRFANRYRLDLLTDEQALDAIKLPAEKAGVHFTDAAAQKLVDDLRTMKVQRADGTINSELGPYVEPVQLQVACERLWKNLAATDLEITEKHIKELGDVDKSLAKYYAEQVVLASRGRQALERQIREWFTTQLIIEQGEQGMRNQVMMSPEKSGGLDNNIISFLEKRHLVRGERRHGMTWYELAHDRLVDPIREDNREWFEQKLSVLQRQSALWIKHDRADYLLLRGEELEKAERWADEHDSELLETEKEFLQACQNVRTLEKEKERAQQRELEMAAARERAEAAQKLANEQAQRRESELAAAQERAEAWQKLADEQARSALRARRFSIGAIVLVVIALIASFIAYQQKKLAGVQANDAIQAQQTAQAAGDEAKKQAAISRSKELSARAANKRLDLSILLSIEAFRKNDNFQTKNTLITALQESSSINNFSFIPEMDGTTRVSPDGKIVATLGKDGVILWDTKGTKLGGPFGGPPAPAYSVAYSPDGKILATSDKDGSIVLWNAESDEPFGPPLREHTAWVNSVAFSPDGKLLASASDDQTVILWDVTDPGKPQKKGLMTGSNDCVANAVFSPDNKTLATSQCNSGTITLWNINDPEEPKMIGNEFGDQSDTVLGLIFSQDGKTLFSGSWDYTIALWDLTDPTAPTMITTLDLSASVYGLAISRDGKTLASGSDDGGLFLWDITDLTGPVQIKELKEHEAVVNSVAFNPNGKTLASAGFDGKVILWDAAKGESLSHLERGIFSPANIAVFNPAGDRLAVTYEDGSTLIWDVSTPERPQRVGSPLQYPAPPDVIEFSSDGGILKMSNESGNILLDVNNRAIMGSGDVRFQDPKGKFLVYQNYDSATVSYATQVFDIVSGKPAGAPAPGGYLSISQDGHVMAYQTSDVEENSSINLWDVAKGKMIGSPVPGSFLSLSQDGTTLAYYGSDQTGNRLITFLNITKGASTSMQGDYVALSQDGKILLYKVVDKKGNSELHILNRETGKDDPIGEIGDCSDPILSPDGSALSCQTTDKDNNSFFTLFDTTSWNSIGTPVRDFRYVNQSLEGNILAYQIFNDNAGEYRIIIVDTTTRGQVYQIGDVNGEFKAFTPDGRILVYQAGAEIKQWDTFSHSPIDGSFEGEFLGMSRDGKTLTLRQGSLIENLDLTNTSTLGSPLSKEPSEKIQVAALSPDGKVLAKFGNEGILLQEATSEVAIGKPFNEHIGVGGINAASFNPDGASIIFSGDDGNIKVWEIGSRRPSGESIPAAPGSTLLLSPDGRTLAVIDSQTNTVTVWDLATRTQIDQPVSGYWAVFSQDGSYLAVSSWENRSNTLFDLNDRKLVSQTFPGYSAAFSPDRKTLIVGDYDNNTAKLWDLSTLKQIGPDIPGYYGVFSTDGNILAIYGTSDTTTLWDLATRKAISEPLQGYVYAFSPDGRVLAVGNSQENATTLWNLADHSQIGDPFPGTSAYFNLSGNALAVINYQGQDNTTTTTLWDWVTHRQIGGTIPGTNYAFSPDGKALAYAGGTGVIVWNGDSQSAPGDTTLPYSGAISGTAFSKDGTTLAIYGSEGLVLYDLNTRERIGDPIGSAGRVSSLRFSPNGGLLASVGDDGIILTEVNTQKKIGDTIRGNNVIFSPDSTKIAVSDQNNATVLFDTVNGNQIGEAILGSNPIFSPDGKKIATYDGKDTKINLWSSDTQEAINKESIPGNDVRFSPDGKTMAVINSIECISSDKDCTQISHAITLWNVGLSDQFDKGEEIPIESICSSDQPNCVLVVFSPDGKTLAYSDAGAIILWDVAKHQQIGDPVSDASEASNLAFIRNGQFLVLGDTNGFTTLWDVASRSLFGNSILGLFQLAGMDANSNTFLIKKGEEWSLWKFDPEDWIKELCAKVGRNLTQDELVSYGFADTGPYRPTCPQWP